MNKKLLMIIPAFMLLASCSGVSNQPKNNGLQEDNYAHEELFGDAEEAEELIEKKAPRGAGEVLDPIIGVQYKTVGDRDYIRFVGAITTRSVTAKWVRGVAKQDASVTLAKYDDEKKEYNYKESTTAYKSLLNGSDVKVVPPTGYEYFVCYTLSFPTNNVDYKYSYVAAYLEINDGVKTYTSKVAAIEMGNAHHEFSFDKDDVDGNGEEDTSDYFIQGTILSTPDTIDLLDDTTIEKNLAQKTIAFNTDDIFGVFKWSSTDFNFFGYEDRTFEKFYTAKDESISSNYSRVKQASSANYTLYLNEYSQYGLVNNGDHFQVSVTVTGAHFDLDGDSCGVLAYVWGGSQGAIWIKANIDEDHRTVTFNCLDDVQYFILVRVSSEVYDSGVGKWKKSQGAYNKTSGDTQFNREKDTPYSLSWTDCEN